MILVSACLAGFNCRYNGKSCYDKEILKLISNGYAIPVCPEILGGLTTPRNPMEIKQNTLGKKHVIDKNGKDYTKEIFEGSQECLKIAKLNNVEFAILKSNSPSCGFGKIYNGNFDGCLKKGNGITAELLNKNGIRILNEQNYKEELKK